MVDLRKARQSSQGRTAERWLLEALDDMRSATTMLKAAESKLLSHLKTREAEVPDCGKEPARRGGAVGVRGLALLAEEQTGTRKRKLASLQ